MNTIDTRPIFTTIDRALQDEIERWTYDVPDEFRLALSRAVTQRLHQGSMLNHRRPWESDT